jgi:hypothetical protein
MCCCCVVLYALYQLFLRPQRKIRKEHGMSQCQNLLLSLQGAPQREQISSGDHDVEVRHVLSVTQLNA